MRKFAEVAQPCLALSSQYVQVRYQYSAALDLRVRVVCAYSCLPALVLKVKGARLRENQSYQWTLLVSSSSKDISHHES